MHPACNPHRRCQNSVQRTRTGGADAGKSACTSVQGAARCKEMPLHLGAGAGRPELNRLKCKAPCGILPRISARAGFLSGAGTGLSRSPAPRKRSATTQTTYTALRRGSCCTLCSRLRPQLRRWKAASEAPQRGRGRRMRFCYSQLELAALPEVEGDAQKNDILTGRVSPKLALDATKGGGS